MRSELFDEKPKTLKTSLGRWVRIMPDQGEGYPLLDLTNERGIGRMLVNEKGYWIYGGSTLDLNEQDEVAGEITGHHHEMNNLLMTLNFSG